MQIPAFSKTRGCEYDFSDTFDFGLLWLPELTMLRHIRLTSRPSATR